MTKQDLINLGKLAVQQKFQTAKKLKMGFKTDSK